MELKQGAGCLIKKIKINRSDSGGGRVPAVLYISGAPSQYSGREKQGEEKP